MSKIYLGIDPGANGGIAWVDEDGALIECRKMPSTPRDIYDILGSYLDDDTDIICYLEKVGFGMPGQSSKATATFSRHCGQLEMALLAREIATIEVTPMKWQKYFGLQGKQAESKTSHKNRIKAWAQQRFPRCKVTLWGADALALAEYGREQGVKG